MRIKACSLVLLAATSCLVAQESPKRMPEDFAIYRVSQDGDTTAIDPVVIVHYADQRSKSIPSLNPPIPIANWQPSDFDALESQFYKRGSAIHLFAGGERVGDAKLVGNQLEGRDGGCINLSASIALNGRPSQAPLLASSRAILGHRSQRHAASPQQANLLRGLAERWLEENGLDRQNIQNGTMSDVVVTELRKGAGEALIGRFDVKSSTAIHQLFAVAESRSGKYVLTLTDLAVQHDVEDGSDKTDRQYIDQIDVDNDGQDEIITLATHYESTDYAIWSFDPKSGNWRKTYSGGGGGC